MTKQEERDQKQNSKNDSHPVPKQEEEAPKRLPFADKLKFAGLIAFLLILVGIGFLLAPYYSYFGTEEGRLELIEIIHNAGVWGVLVSLGLQLLQIVVAFIPGEVVQLIIGAIYGPFWGTVVLTAGACISSIFIFFLVRRLGAPFVHGMISKNHEDKLNVLSNNKRLDTIVFILFLIPGLPKDIFTYLVPLTKMRAVNFIVLATIARIPGIAASSYIGDAFIQGDYTGAIVVSIIAGGLGLLGIIFNQRIMKLVDYVERRLPRKK